MLYDQIININLGHDIKPSISLLQFDSGRRFVIYIEDFSIPEQSDVKIYVKKPSGHEVLNPCTSTGNRVETPCTVQMAAETGISEAQLQITCGGTFLTSFPFTLKVSENPSAHNEIASSDEYRILEDLIDQARGIFESEAGRAAAEKSRSESEAVRISAESSRCTAENNRKAAESSRSAAESARVTAETSRTAAESARSAAEDSRRTAESARAAAETGRVAAETGRETAEKQRTANDAGRETRITDIENELEQVNGIVNNMEDIYVRRDGDSITLGKGTIAYDAVKNGFHITFVP